MLNLMFYLFKTTTFVIYKYTLRLTTNNKCGTLKKKKPNYKVKLSFLILYFTNKQGYMN